MDASTKDKVREALTWAREVARKSRPALGPGGNDELLHEIAERARIIECCDDALEWLALDKMPDRAVETIGDAGRAPAGSLIRVKSIRWLMFQRSPEVWLAEVIFDSSGLAGIGTGISTGSGIALVGNLGVSFVGTLYHDGEKIMANLTAAVRAASRAMTLTW